MDIDAARGCTRTLEITITNGADDSIYILEENDRLLFTLALCDKAVMRKTLTQADQDADGVIVMIINPQDTINLLPADYRCDLTLYSGSAIMQVMPSTKFCLYPTFYHYKIARGGHVCQQ